MLHHFFFQKVSHGRMPKVILRSLSSDGMFKNKSNIKAPSLNVSPSWNKTTPFVLTEYVDIYCFPEIDDRYIVDKDVQITIGDLHANTMKLIFLLVKHQVVTNITIDDYHHLVQIYEVSTQDQTKHNLMLFNQIINKMNVNNQAFIRFIGDEVADRLHNDYFTLCVLLKLQKHGLPMEIMLSNHGIEFIHAYEVQSNFHPIMLNPEHANSMANLQLFIEKKWVSLEEINNMIMLAYKPMLKLLSYSFIDNTGIIIYSHAGIDFNIIEGLSQMLDTPYHDETLTELSKTIDNINSQFYVHARNNTIHTLCQEENMASAYLGYVDLKKSPFEALIWNRQYDELDRPSLHNGFSVYFIHGHHTDRSMGDHVFNLDNALGKSTFHHEGDYTIILTSSQRLEPGEDQTQKEASLVMTNRLGGHHGP